MHAVIEVGGALYDEGLKLLQDGEGDEDIFRDAKTWFGKVTHWLYWRVRELAEKIGDVAYVPIEWMLRQVAGDNAFTRFTRVFISPLLGLLIIGFILGVLTSEAVRRTWAAVKG